MTAIAFHFGAPDKMEYAGRLLRKAVAKGAKVTVLAEPAQVRYLDSSLWATAPVDFLVHAVDNGGPPPKACPVMLTTQLHAELHSHSVLVNLSQSVPEGFTGFERLIEVVADHEEDRAVARARWKRYRQQGFVIERHDLTLRDTA